jgi:RNA polymerase sigma-70 factor (ECF subfamily)
MNPRPDDSSIASTSTSLLDRVRAHDQEAWKRLVRLYGPLVDFWIRRSGLQPADREDLFQEVFRSVATHIGAFRKDAAAGSFRGWLRIITRSKVVDHQRKRDQTRPLGGPDSQQRMESLPDSAHLDDDAALDEQERQELDALRRRALELVRSEYEERTWQMFWRSTVEGDAVADIAAEMSVTPSAVRLAKSRVLRRLRDELAGLEP